MVRKSGYQGVILSGTTVVAMVLVQLLALSAFAQDRQLIRPKADEVAEKRIALVIGNGAYTKASRLANATNDARDMAVKLRELGFEVIGGEQDGINIGQAAMESLVSRFGTRLAETKGVGLFFFAGHGVTSAGQNYLIPVDADIPDETLVKYKAVPVGYVLDKMAAAGNAFNLVILDACRNNPFARQWRTLRDIGDSRGLVNSNPAKGTLVLYATQPGGVAIDGAAGSRNGVFTGALLKNIDQSDVELDRLVKLVARDVEATSDEKQSPWKEGLYSGDFYFRRSAGQKNDPQPDKVPNDRTRAEREAWDLVKNSSDPGDLRLYLKEFPKGANAGNAWIKLEGLVWLAAKESSDKAKLEAYLTEFPSGANAAAARLMLRQLEAPDNSGKTISGGVLNGKATQLVIPTYPAAAKAVRASGQVNVQVMVDENGNVISASAVSGHP